MVGITAQCSAGLGEGSPMIFNEFSYFALFLLPAVVLFHTLPSRTRPWVIGFFGATFFVYYGYLHFGGLWGALCVLLFVWEMVTSRLYRPGSRWCLFGIAQAIVILFAFKYLTFAIGSWNDLAATLHLPPLGAAKRWLLPLGVSFFTFEFIHFAADTYWARSSDRLLANMRRSFSSSRRWSPVRSSVFKTSAPS